ncbi:AAA family ATPase [Rhodocytophaga aerolata]|uniref:AAA family ATPase n=1 Tax=Rhodocytophaga aerolata TaxID=455078 RepID=A0ABT8R7D5_9BACT|nr:AAA family ATPase [Rhodocytophaga aerolata]MDO1447158.1 AAA family ATPase [Rhodocytophaga aerolata]
MKVSPAQLLAKKFPFTPTQGQADLFRLLEYFILEKEKYRQVFLLKGFAGTGKTTVVSTLIEVVRKFGYKYVMLAPTGRAAKVMTNYSKQKASTIHKKVYWQKADPYTGNLVFERQKNYHTNTIFVVDEASMISDETDFIGGNGLLADLIDYVFEDESNKLMLIGDAAQLPPVGRILSPALDSEYLKLNFDVSVLEKELEEVMRQDEQSGILINATALRNVLLQNSTDVKLHTKYFPDIYRMTSEKLEDGLRYAYNKYGTENTIIICRSNKAATQYNQYIRRTIHFTENEIDVGDILMVVRNNYTTLDEGAPAGFLANGDFVEIMRVRSTENMYGFRFANLQLRLIDYPEQPEFEAKILLDTLHSYAPALNQEDNKKLYDNVVTDYAYIRSKKERNEVIKKDPYLNALQVKFAYALTCHKSQGGQWNAVFVDQGFLTQEGVNADFLRWLYTAMTRATNELFLMNFDPQFFIIS